MAAPTCGLLLCEVLLFCLLNKVDISFSFALIVKLKVPASFLTHRCLEWVTQVWLQILESTWIFSSFLEVWYPFNKNWCSGGHRDSRIWSFGDMSEIQWNEKTFKVCLSDYRRNHCHKAVCPLWWQPPASFCQCPLLGFIRMTPFATASFIYTKKTTTYIYIFLVDFVKTTNILKII